jgi:hypothetical protein
VIISTDLIARGLQDARRRRQRQAREWDEMADREARAEIDRVLSVLVLDDDPIILDYHVKLVIAARWPDGNPYRKAGE